MIRSHRTASEDMHTGQQVIPAKVSAQYDSSHSERDYRRVQGWVSLPFPTGLLRYPDRNGCATESFLALTLTKSATRLCS